MFVYYYTVVDLHKPYNKKERKIQMTTQINNILNVTYTPEEKLMRGRIQLNRQYPFFGYLVAYMKFRDLQEKPFGQYIPTLAVTSGTTIMYQPSYIESITDNDAVLGVLAHEVMHLALKHNERQGARTIMLRYNTPLPDGTEVSTYVSLYNIAADIVINNLLVKNNLKLPEGGLIPNNDSYTFLGVEIKDISDKSAEEIYDILAKGIEEKCKQNKNNKGKGKGEGQSIEVSGLSPDKDSQGDKSSSSEKPTVVYDAPKGTPKPSDDHLWDEKGEQKNKSNSGDEEGDGDPSKSNGEDENDFGKIDWDKIVAEAKEHAVRRGNVPAGMEREFQVVKTKRLNLDAFLRRTIGQFVPMDYSWRRPNKNMIYHDCYMPSTYGEKIKILFSIDTSGSVTQEDLTKYMSIISDITKSHDVSVEFRLLTHDADVHDDYHMYNGNMDKIKQIKIHGGGGTNHIPLFDYIFQKKYHRDTKLLISFTDGYSCYPEKVPRGFHVVFVLAGRHCPEKDMPDWATTVVYHNY